MSLANEAAVAVAVALCVRWWWQRDGDRREGGVQALAQEVDEDQLFTWSTGGHSPASIRSEMCTEGCPDSIVHLPCQQYKLHQSLTGKEWGEETIRNIQQC